MTDMTAFEQQLSAGFKGLMGPSEPVDDAAIYTSIAATQSPKWTFNSMFSATKFVVAGAIVALFGGVLLVAQPLERQASDVPGATTDEAASKASVVSGQFEQVSFESVERSRHGGLPGHLVYYRDQVIGAQAEMSDVRLSGEVTGTIDSDLWDPQQEACHANVETPNTCVRLDWGTLDIENDEGAWAGTWVRQFAEPQVWLIELVGTEGYEGWSAILSTTDDLPNLGGTTTPWSVTGIVFDGNLPPDREAYVEE